jgi:dipeptidyl aminopeptidase/acylaminoacyl peptidase
VAFTLPTRLEETNRAKTPTLFIDGAVDQRVPFSEAQPTYVALEQSGVTAKMIQYAGQPHGIAGSWNIVHGMRNERAWLDMWMKGTPLQYICRRASAPRPPKARTRHEVDD